MLDATPDRVVRFPGVGPVQAYRLTPGEALVYGEDGVPAGTVRVSRAGALRAEYLYLLKWHSGRVVCLFLLDGRTVAQAVPSGSAKPGKPRKRQRAGLL